LVIVPPVIAGVILVMVPGLVIAYAATARGMTAWGLAPGLSMTVYTVLALVYGAPHAKWNLLTVCIGTIVLVVIVALAVWALTRRFGIRPGAGDPRVANWFAVVGVAVAFLAIAIRFAVIFVHPDAISQTFDNNFHLNGIRYIIDTGEASPLTFSDLQYAFHGFGSFYPNLWHAVASLIAESSGASIAVTVNAFSIVIGGVIWPLSCVFLMRQVLGPKPLALLATGVFSVGLGSFPTILIGWGVLYPNLLGLALVPCGMGALVLATRLATGAQLGSILGWIAFFALLPGIALAHPNALVSLLSIGLPAVCVGWWLWFRRMRHARPGWRTIATTAAVAVAAAVAYAAVFVYVRPPASAASWGPIAGLKQSLYMGFLNAEFGNVPAFVITALAVLGVVYVIVWRRHRWLIASAVLVEALFFFTAYLPIGHARLWLTGTWYSDIYRIIALFPIVLTPLAAIGVVWLGELVMRIVRRNSIAPESNESRTVLATLALILVLGTVAQVEPSMQAATQWTAGTYELTPKSILLSTDERALIERLPKEVPAGAVVAGDPWTGTALAWALADRRVIAPHVYASRPPAANLILESLRNAKPGSAVCRAVAEEGVTYALDFGTRGVFGPTNQYPGVHHLGTSKAVTLVDHVGAAALYKVTGCG